MQDLEVKEKLDNITPLSAGIVFGKEDAWDKLQARLDTPPKVIAFPYRTAAIAASLLALVGIVYYFVQNDAPAVVATTTKTVVTPAPPPVTSTEPNVVLLDTAPARPVRRREPEPPAPAVVIPTPAAPQLATTDALPPTTTPVPEPPSIPPVKMKVIHINEIGKLPEPEPSFASGVPHLNYKNMKVISIYDLNMYKQILHEETEALSAALQSRPASFITLAAPLSNMQHQPAEATPHNPISIRLNRNN